MNRSAGSHFLYGKTFCGNVLFFEGIRKERATGHTIYDNIEVTLYENRTTYFLDTYEDKGFTYSYKIPTSVLGSNGKKLYARIRAVGTLQSIDGDTSDGAVTSTGFKVGDTLYSSYENGVCWKGSSMGFGGKKYAMEAP